jgi:uncharacterized cupredoxin-like copper-binding protein
MYKHLLVVAMTGLVASTYAHSDEPPAHHQQSGGHHAHPSAQENFGRPGDARMVDRTIVVEMRDPIEFSPAAIDVKSGETIRFVVRNTGKHEHEMVLGTLKDLEAHNEEMKAHPSMQHAEPHMVHLGPGESGVIVWRFTRPGEFHYACLVEDHFDLGMYGKIRVAGEPTSAVNEHAHEPMPEHQHEAQMYAMYGAYPMTRDASGTSWVPDSSPHEGIAASAGDWSTMTHGFVNLIYDHQGGPRGDSKTFSTSMLMTMAQRRIGEGTLGLRGMVSADALMGKRGYPLLLQTGESANGAPLIDRQHPHDLFMELAASYSHPLTERSSAFIYAGLPGEPALGPPAFMHRFSGADNPEAPISHHWLDATHTTFGVVTLGYIYDRLKIEGSVFRGREPDENRYDIETGKLDSASARLSYNPTRDWALQVSRGRIKSPEALHPDVDVDRTTASAIYRRPIGNADMQTTLAWGRNAPSHGDATNAFLLEAALRMSRSHTFFARAERVDKNELFPDGDPRTEERFRVSKLSVGYICDWPRESGFRIGVGGLVSRYSLPSELGSVYGNPTSFMLFARVKIR